MAWWDEDHPFMEFLNGYVDQKIQAALCDTAYLGSLDTRIQGKINDKVDSPDYNSGIDARIQGIIDDNLNSQAFQDRVKSLSRGTYWRTDVLGYPEVPLIKDVDAKRLAMWIGLGDLKVGDMLRINSIIQTTNENAFTVAWNGFITLNSGGALFSGQLGRSTGRNLLRDIHHDGLTIGKTVKLTVPYTNAYLALCVTAKPLVGSGSVPAGSVLELNYGELSVEKVA